MDSIDQLQELRELDDRIICTATFEVRCGACRYRDTVYIQIPVSKYFFEDRPALELFLDHRFTPAEAKAIADRHGCDRCHEQDFEIGAMTRLPAYRDGDPLRLPVEVA
jgi:hypothetical protein